jgi:small-conductance mechanosensitive channel
MILKPRFIIDKIDAKRRNSVFLIIKFVGWVVSIFLAIKVLGFEIQALLFGSTALLIGLGFGLQNIFKDFVSGLFLLFEGSLKIGDIVEVDGTIGKVMEINLRSSEILTRDDVIIIIPNSKFIAEKVTNWSHDNESVRFTVHVSVAYGSDVDKVYECLEEAMKENEHTAKSPEPFIRFAKFGESALEFEMFFWSSATFRIENVKSDLRRSVYKKLAENGLAIPFPQRDVHIKGIEHMVDFKQQKEKN